MSVRTWRRMCVLVAMWLGVAAWPSPASGQWYFVGYGGSSHTRPADVTVEVPSADLAATFHDVRFAGESYDAPIYYGWRAGRMLGARRRHGLELEFIHLKVIAETTGTYTTTGRLAGLDPSTPQPMDALVQRYSMTHGLNFIVINGVARRELHARLAVVGRLGAGATLPHAETTVLGAARERYEWAGAAGHLALGTDLRLRGVLSLVTEYKLTVATPRISLAGSGLGHTRAISHQFAFGLALGFRR